jgi:ribosomal protein L40E
MESPRWWAWVAGVLLVVFLYYETGSLVVVGLCAAALGGFELYRSLRAPKSASVVCMKCGANLNPNARQCRNCGSASWTWKN